MKQIICYKCGQSIERFNDSCPEKEKHKNSRGYKKFEHYIERRLHPTGWDKKMAELDMTMPKVYVATKKRGSYNKGRKWSKEHFQKLVDNSRKTKENILGKIIKNI